ncbi:MAG: thermonuclease family protein [Planctomycetes bacterium]|nr:thermonuclease family protein [Planctomycetota bacterium]
MKLRSVLSVLSVLVLAMTTGCEQAETRLPEAGGADIPEGWHRVARVVDGDTFEIENGELVRLLGVDTPELHHSLKKVEYYAETAYAFVRDRMEGRLVRLVSNHGTQELEREKYGRIIAYAYLEDGTCLNETLIQEGYAFAYTKASFGRKKEYLALEASAKARAIGVHDEAARILYDLATDLPVVSFEDSNFIAHKQSKLLHTKTCGQLPTEDHRVYFHDLGEAGRFGYTRLHRTATCCAGVGDE